MIMKRIYLDYAAMTPTSEKVLQEICRFNSFDFGNPSSMYKSARLSADVIKKAKESVASEIGANSGEIFFTGSGTESDNLAIFGVARRYKDFGKHIIISSIEHKAVLESALHLQKEGFEISFAKVDKKGRIDLPYLLSLVREDTILVSIIYVNNEIGTIQNIKDIFSKIGKQNGGQFPIFHTDACQAAGHLKIDVKNLGVDLLSLNGSKIYGPKGVGVLYKKDSLQIDSIIKGGFQENGLRAGTESLSQIMGFTTALSEVNKNMKNEELRLSDIKNYLQKRLQNDVPDILINSPDTDSANHILHVTVPDIEGESMVLMLDQHGIEVATGSACSSNDLQPSHVLTAIGQDEELVHGSIRFSFGKHTTKKDVDYLMNFFPQVVEKLKAMSILTAKVYEK